MLARVDVIAQIPLLLPALVVLVAGWAEWRRDGGSRPCARVALGAGTALLIAALRYPGESAAAVLEHTEDGLVYLVAVARVAGFAALLFAALGAVRGRL